MNDAIDNLKKFGLNEYQSKTVIALMKNNGVTAKQIASDAGIKEVLSGVNSANTPSVKMHEKLGFRKIKNNSLNLEIKI